MTERLELTTPWTADRAPQVIADHLIGSGSDWTISDVTAKAADEIHPGDLNNVVVECDAATAAAIEADSTYFVLWRETVTDG